MQFARKHASLLAFSLLAGTQLVGCGAAGPSHSGYRNASSQPWNRARAVTFDEDREAEIDGTVSYPKRRRARWYSFDLPVYGEVTIVLEAVPLRNRRDFDLPIEIFDDQFQSVMSSSVEDEDYTELNKERILYDRAPGRYYVHVYARSRVDEVDFTLRLRYKKVPPSKDTTFAGRIKLPGPLPIVPVVDDNPRVNCRRCSCADLECKNACGKCIKSAASDRPRKDDRSKSGDRCERCDCKGSCRYSCPSCRPDCSACKCDDKLCKRWCKTKCSSAIASSAATSGSIVGVVGTARGTRITINRGSNHGVAAGWRGSVVRGGSTIRLGSFRVSRVTPTRSYAVVKASVDDVISAKRVRLRP